MALDLRSLRSDEKCYLRFVNKTNRAVDIMWIDFTGNFVKYALLERGQFIDINTYKSHPWFAVDSVTFDSMLLNKEFTYLAKTQFEILSNPPINRRLLTQNLRTIVHITIPLYSLWYRCLLEVRNHLNKEDDVDSLEITNRLKEELKKMIRHKNNRSVRITNTTLQHHT